MKVNKAIFLTYTANSSNATASINVNFPVKSIHVKSAVYQSTLPTTADTQQYITLFSDLTNGEPYVEIIDFELKTLDYFNHYFTNVSKMYLLLISLFANHHRSQISFFQLKVYLIFLTYF